MTKSILIYLATAGAALAHPGHLPHGPAVETTHYQYELIIVLGLFAYAVALGYPALRARLGRKPD